MGDQNYSRWWVDYPVTHRLAGQSVEITPVGEVKRVRSDVQAVIREWESYPDTYPRSAFIEDLRAALNGDRG